LRRVEVFSPKGATQLIIRKKANAVRKQGNYVEKIAAKRL